MGSKQLGSKFLKRSQICSHTPSALNAGAKRSGATCHYGHASMLLLGEGSEATEPYNKYDKIRPHSIRSQQFDQKVRPLSFRPEKFDLFTATHFIIEDYLKSFRPASVDPERLFSLCRFSKDYLQCRLTAEHHSRNVFINKNERFLG